MSTEETNGVTPAVHSSPIVEEAVDASGVPGGVTADGAFVPADAQSADEIESNAPEATAPTIENTEHGITDEEEASTE